MFLVKVYSKHYLNYWKEVLLVYHLVEEENIQNEQQRKNLQETIDFLDETLKRIEEAQKKRK